MIKRLLLSAMTAFAVFSSCYGIVSGASLQETVIHVSVTGDDTNSGSENSPLRTLEGARMAVRKNANFRKKPIRVIFHEGTYYFEDGVEFDKKDSTVKFAPVSYEAAEGEEVIFSGAKEIDISNFELVTDETVLSALPESSRGKVYQTTLDPLVYGKFAPFDTAHYYSDDFDGSGGYISVSVNGKEQMESQWPNGKYAYAGMGTILFSSVPRYTNPKNTPTTPEYGPEFKYLETNPDRWLNAKYARFSGCASYTWCQEEATIHKIDPVENTIKLAHPFWYGATGAGHRIWKVFNLIEELDVPTEWYFDIDKNILYYYPPQGFFEKENKMEIIYLDEAIVKTTATKNIKFKGITFSNSRFDFILLTEDSTCEIEDCSFVNGKKRGVRAMQSIAEIYNSRFMNISSTAILVRGKVLDYDTQKNADLGTTRIIGNYFYDVASKGRNNPHAIWTLDANNFEINHNTFHNLVGGGITGGFANSKMLYNEFYNYGQQYSDMGAFYEGQTKSRVKKELAYNFCYDYTTKNEKLAKMPEVLVQGFYMDDAANYAYIHDNMFYNGNYASMMLGGGQYNTAERNIIIDMKGTPISVDNRTEVWLFNYIPNYLPQSLYVANVMDNIIKYPYVANVPHDTIPPYGNRVADNISNTEFKFNSRFAELSDMENNITVKDLSSFVDPENLDFRLKSDSPLGKKYPSLNEDNFDLSKVGCELSVTEDIERSFSLISPIDKEVDFDYKENLLLWEDANMADKYHLVIAKDKNFKEIVFDDDVPYNWYKGENLENNTEYFWKVTAKNTSFKRKSQWESESGVMSFVTSNGKRTVLKNLENKISYVTDNFINKIDAEDYNAAKVSALKTILKKSANMLKNADGVSLEEINSQIDKVQDAYDKASGSRVVAFAKIDEKYFKDRTYWTSGTELKFTEKSFSFDTDNMSAVGNVNLEAEQPENAIMQFKVKVDFGDDNSLVSFDVRRKTGGTEVWNDRGYTAIVKKNQIELQKYPSPAPLIEILPNNVIKSGQWHEIAIGAVNYVDYVRFIFMVDGKVVFNFCDEQKSVMDNGFLGLFLTQPNKMELAPSEIEYDMTSFARSVEYSVDTPTCSLNGTDTSSSTVSGEWQNTEYKGYGEDAVKVNDGKGSITWKFKPGSGEKAYKFWKYVSADGDKKAQLSITYDYTKASDGEEVTLVSEVDFTEGESGWITIDTADVLDDNAEVIITLKGSGTGNLYANAVQSQEIDE